VLTTFALLAVLAASEDTKALEAQANQNIAAGTAGVPPVKARSALVRIETEARGVFLVDRVDQTKRCAAPCGEKLTFYEHSEWQLVARGFMDSAPFSLSEGQGDAVVRWRPASLPLRIVGIALAGVGFLSLLLGTGIALFAALSPFMCAIPEGCRGRDTNWGLAAIPLAGGGAAFVGLGAVFIFRFGFERLHIDVAPVPAGS
jgi:hypothetical protein